MPHRIDGNLNDDPRAPATRVISHNFMGIQLSRAHAPQIHNAHSVSSINRAKLKIISAKCCKPLQGGCLSCNDWAIHCRQSSRPRLSLFYDRCESAAIFSTDIFIVVGVVSWMAEWDGNVERQRLRKREKRSSLVVDAVYRTMRMPRRTHAAIQSTFASFTRAVYELTRRCP